MFLTRSDNNIIKERSKVFSEGLLAVNETETLNRSFTIILAVHQPYSIMLHVTYVYKIQADLQTLPRKGLKPCLTFYPTYDWELAFHISHFEIEEGTGAEC